MAKNPGFRSATIYIPKFYTDVVGVHISALGMILLIVRLFDAFTDPLIGIVSDRIHTPMGRRRPFIAVGAAFTVLAIAFLFNPPEGMGADAAGLYFMALIFALFLFWTVVTVPYESLGPELTFDYNDRTALFSMRAGALNAGIGPVGRGSACSRSYHRVNPFIKTGCRSACEILFQQYNGM